MSKYAAKMESTLTLQLSTTNTTFSIAAPGIYPNCMYGDYIFTVLIKLTWKIGQCSDYK